MKTIAQQPSLFASRFEEYHAENPHVYEAFKKFTLELVNAGCPPSRSAARCQGGGQLLRIDMAEVSKIEWTDATFNPWRGCTKVSPACENCYADTMSKRNPGTLGVWGKYGTRTVAVESYWKLPLKWDRWAREGVCLKCQGKGIVKSKEFDWQPCENCDQNGRVEPYRARVFCASLADVFEGDDTMPKAALRDVYAARRRLWELIEATPFLDWLLLTKRPECVIGKVPIPWVEDGNGFPDNVWIGTTVENQKYADIRIPELLKIPAKVRFLSVEPMLGPVNLESYLQYPPMTDNYKMTLGVEAWRGIEWVIVGGESGSNARPMHPEWARSIRDQCKEAEVPFLFKQWGEFAPVLPEGTAIVRIGKKNAGRLLDRRTWDELPEVAR